MAPLSIPPELKKINPYVRRAEELDKDKSNAESRLVAYYCRQYAVHAGIPLAATSSAAKECLGVILGQLEEEKDAMDNFSKDEAKFLCAQFANRIFNKANDEDVNGNADKNTAKTFYAAASFLQILDQFYPDEGAELDEEVAAQRKEEKNKILYAKWKSTEILKAIKEGRTPTPGGYEKQEEGEQEAEQPPPQEDQQERSKEEEIEAQIPPPPSFSPPVVTTVVNDDDSSNGDADPTIVAPPPSAPDYPPISAPPPLEDENEGTEVQLGPPPAYMDATVDKPPLSFQPPTAPPPPPTMDDFNLPSVPSAPPPPVVAPRHPAASPKRNGKGGMGSMFGFGKKKGGKISKAQFSDAIELTKFALAALEEKDAELGTARLEQALQVLKR